MHFNFILQIFCSSAAFLQANRWKHPDCLSLNENSGNFKVHSTVIFVESTHVEEFKVQSTVIFQISSAAD